MLQETSKIIEMAVKLDHTLSEGDRARIMKAIKSTSESPRELIKQSDAMRILGLSPTTWYRRLASDPAFQKLCRITTLGSAKYYRDEIEALRDGILA